MALPSMVSYSAFDKRRKSEVLMFCCLFCKYLVNQPKMNYCCWGISREAEEETSPDLEEMGPFLLSSSEKSIASSASSLGGLLGTETKLGGSS